MQTSKKLPLSAAIATVITLAALSGCTDDKNSPSKAGMPAPSVSVVAVGLEPVGEYQEFSARTDASESVDLRARVEGYLENSNFTEGQTVQKGQQLFAIDPAPFKAALSQAKAALGSARAEEVRAEADLKRGRELFPKGHISQSDFDRLVANEAQASANVESAKAQLESSTINLSYTKIYAPFSGLIGKETYSNGSLVGPTSEPLAELISINPIYVNFQVNESALLNHNQRNLAQGSVTSYDISLQMPNGMEYNKPGTFDFTDVKVDETTGTVDVRATFPNSEKLLLPGMYVTLMIESTKKTAMPLIPQYAVQENQQGRFVLVVNQDNKVETRIVKLGRRIGPMWAVTSGLQADEKIIVSGLQKVRPGVTVKPQLMSVNRETGTLTGTKPAQTSAATPSATKGAQ